MPRHALAATAAALATVVALSVLFTAGERVTAGEEDGAPGPDAQSPASQGPESRGPFAPSSLRTASGGVADADWYYEAEVCGECHATQYADWKGSLHSRAHDDALYLAFAERARAEGGDELYRFCSSCHAPGAVATGEIPGGEGTEHTFLTHEGVTCDVCHSVSQVVTRHAGGGANASIVLEEGEVRFGPRADPARTPAHESAYSRTHTESRLCSACHSLTHPHNGVVIENTFEEWSRSPYAAAGIQCQDCHMRTVAEAVRVAETMAPVVVPGESATGVERPDVHRHLFVGANVNAELVGASERHAAEAEARLRSAATVTPEGAGDAGADELRLAVAVTNVAAGHSIPTSITELRQVWLDVRVTDADGSELYRSGRLEESGAIQPGAVVYTTTLHDAEGQVTYLPWKAVRIAHENLLHAKETRRETYVVPLPGGVRGPLAARAVLRYRSAPQEVLDELFGKGRLVVRNVDMAEAEAVVTLD